MRKLMLRMTCHWLGRLSRVLGALVTVAATLASGATSASAAPLASASHAAVATDAVSADNTVITAFSAPGDSIGRGISNEFDVTNASITGTAATTGIKLVVIGGTTGHAWTFVVDPPRGSTLHVGNYPTVELTPDRTGKLADLSITGEGHGCGELLGSYSSVEVRDLAVSGSRITRLDLLYVMYCDASPGALFGEIRIGEPQPSGLLVSASSITWSPTWIGGPLTVPITIRNRGAKRVPAIAARVTGFSASDFKVGKNSCSGKVLAPGASCSLTVTFEPSPPGPRTAALQIRLGTVVDTVQLDVPVPVGTTSLTMHSQPGDFVGQGKNWNYNARNAGFYVAAAPTRLVQNVWVGGPWLWGAALAPAAGNTLTVGRYADASSNESPDPDDDGNYLEVSGDARGCDVDTGEFTVKQAVFSGSVLEHFDATFIQHCDGAAPALTGEIKYDSAPVVTPPAGVSRLTATRRGGAIELAWKNPAPGRYRYTVVRIERGRPVGVGPSAGAAAYAGAGQRTTIGALSTKETYTIVVFTVDQYGNVSNPAERFVTG
jgi:hypothetical protein